MTKINLIFTFDYELPMGSCRSYQKGIFEPSEALLNVARDQNIKIVLFADICSAIVFKEWDYKGYYLPFANQLKEAISGGHEVQLHLHPGWLNSTFKNEKYYPSGSNTLSNFSDVPYPGNIQGIIETGVKELNEICSEGDNYKCIAYRGGGYNMSPDTDLILTNLYKNGIIYDSSVIKGYYFKSELQETDYRKMPRKANWIIPLDGPMNSSAEKGIIEIPVASMPATPWLRLNRIMKKVRNKNLYKKLKYDNTGSGNSGKKSNLIGSIKSVIYAPLILSFDHLHLDLPTLNQIIQYQLKIYKEEDEITLCVNSHPKTMGKYHLEQMSRFIDVLRTRYKDSVNICGYRDLNF